MGLTIVRGSVVHLSVDAIVSAANEQLSNGGGVALAIAQAAGPELDEACRRLGGCPTGDVRVTQGFRLKAKFVFHAVGPIWQGGGMREEINLRRCYERILEEAQTAGVTSLGAVPLSVGIFGYPLDAGCRIAVEELGKAPADLDVRLMAFTASEYDALVGLGSSPPVQRRTIRFYDRKQPFFEFTNFFHCPIEVDGTIWPTVEHFYQAQKFADPAQQAQVRAANSPRAANDLSKTLGLPKPGFHEGKLHVMRVGLRAKFTQHPDLRAMLLGTADAHLAEASPQDSYWGEGADGKGENWLGRLLMELRADLAG